MGHCLKDAEGDADLYRDAVKAVSDAITKTSTNSDGSSNVDAVSGILTADEDTPG